MCIWKVPPPQSPQTHAAYRKQPVLFDVYCSGPEININGCVMCEWESLELILFYRIQTLQQLGYLIILMIGEILP